MSGSSPTRRGLLAVLLVAPFMAQADATIANVATPAIHSGLGASGAALELVIGGYLIAFAVLLITGARLGPGSTRRTGARFPTAPNDHERPSRDNQPGPR
jgi:MFS family permease